MTARAWLWRAAVAGLALAGAAGAAYLWQVPDASSARSAGLLRPDDTRLIEQGRQVYQAQCASCHGSHLQGQANWRERGPDGRLPAPPHDESGHTWHHPDELLLRITREGVAKAAGLTDYASNMPAFGGALSDADTVAVLSWIKSRWSPDIQARHDEINHQASQPPQR